MAQYQVFIPSISKNNDPQNKFEIILFNLIKNSSYQQRVRMVEHPLLWLAAQKKADDLAEKEYFSHTSPSGVTPNEVIRSVGFNLPDWYAQKGNNVESLYLGGSDPAKALEAWSNSLSHRVHIFAEDKFYRDQECIGVGRAMRRDRVILTVFLSAPCQGN